MINEFSTNLSKDNHIYLGIITILYLPILFLTIKDTFSYKIRSFIIGDIIYAFAVLININYGPIGPALLLYFSVPVLTALLGNKKNSYLWVIGIAITLFLVESIHSAGYLTWDVPYYIQSGSIFILILIFLAISFITVYSINGILDSLTESLKDLQQKENDLKIEHINLNKINIELQKNIENNLINQEKLIRSEEKFKKLFNNAHDSIIIHDLSGNFYDINQSAAERFGLKRDEANGINIKDFIDEENRSLLEIRKKELLELGELTFESRHLNADKEFIDVENTLQVLELDNQKFIINISRDISERKRAEKKIENINKSLQEKVYERTVQLEDALEELRIEINERIKAEDELIKTKEEVVNALEKEKELSKLKTKFVSMISHEYRTPLTVILSTTYILEHLFDKNDKESYLKNIKKIQSSIQLMTNMLEDVLSIGSISDSKTKVHSSEFDIKHLCHNIIEEYKMIEKIPHSYSLESNLDDHKIHQDTKLIRHILRNLIGNASKYSPKDTEIKVNIESEENNIKISVSDQGIGITEEDLDKIFETFYRSDNVGTISGTGLGLSITKNYVDVLNGKIEVESKINEGTTFTVTLPKKYERN